jgi:hypothetical protein
MAIFSNFLFISLLDFALHINTQQKQRFYIPHLRKQRNKKRGALTFNMATTRLPDDPDHINSFLSMIGASPIPRTPSSVWNDECEKPTSGETACYLSMSYVWSTP